MRSAGIPWKFTHESANGTKGCKRRNCTSIYRYAEPKIKSLFFVYFHIFSSITDFFTAILRKLDQNLCFNFYVGPLNQTLIESDYEWVVLNKFYEEHPQTNIDSSPTSTWPCTHGVQNASFGLVYIRSNVSFK